MKKKNFKFIVLYFIMVVMLSVSFISCGSNDDELPSLADIDDVCTAMDDLNLMKWCYENYDVNGDNKVSRTEAAAVRDFTPDEKIELKSVKGLEYFTGVEVLKLKGTFTEIVLQHMPKLVNLYMESYVKTIDLRNNHFFKKITIVDKKRVDKKNDYSWKEEEIIEILGDFGKLDKLEIHLTGIIKMEEIDLTNEGLYLNSSSVLIVKNLIMSSQDVEEYYSCGLGNDIIIENNTYHYYIHYPINYTIFWQTINNSIPKVNTNITSLKGTWIGDMNIFYTMGGKEYDSSNTEITFLTVPSPFSYGTGYWVDYFESAPIPYIAYHIYWTVKKNDIRISFQEEFVELELRNFKVDNGRFIGTFYYFEEGGDFTLSSISRPSNYWDDFRWGWEAYSSNSKGKTKQKIKVSNLMKFAGTR
ncbi:MAG: hypothetical protein SPL55_03365 [Prevotella sp.]|nr:hypothetical protein [Prevotella sp.]